MLLFNYVQTNDYYKIKAVIWTHIIVYEYRLY